MHSELVLPEWSDEPFTLDELLETREAALRCRLEIDAYYKSGIANLAVGRTGSESLTNAFEKNQIYAHHNHDCSVMAVVAAGAKHVMLTLRHPVSRVISGVQRRAKRLRINERKAANRLFNDVFIKNDIISCNPYLDALRNSSHPDHPQALNVTLGRNRQSYMLPLVEFYLNANVQDEPQELKEKALDTEIWFLCTESLTEDFNRAASALGLPEAMQADPTHQSAVHSDQQKDDPDLISSENKAWLETIFANDVELNEIFCGKNSTRRFHSVKLKKVLDHFHIRV